ncbi:DUF4225 domain-containing protein [Enterobacter cloacae]|uniref:DUF4225 domain-containing protein n=1 Tax=Enterobacter cloacae TaxID=550 RepID=UPI0009B576CC
MPTQLTCSPLINPNTGLAFYNGVTLGANVYSINELALKTGAWRLFRWLPHDYRGGISPLIL